MRKMAEERPGLIRLMSDAERESWLQRTLDSALSLDEIWVFAYGSLIWNPAFHWAEKRRCVVAGYQRNFCFWSYMGRGDPQNPGLMLGLEPGGECTGVAYRIEREQIDTELDIVFRRELMSHAYIPSWIEACEADTGEARTFHVLAFVMDPNHERYCGAIDRPVAVKHIATAEGPLGRNCDYLFELVEQLQQLKLVDPHLEQLAAEVRAYQAALSTD